MIGSPTVGVVGWAFLTLAGVMLPLAAAAFAAAERRRPPAGVDPDAAAGVPQPTRLQLYVQVLFTHAVLFGVSIGASRLASVSLFAPVDIGARHWAAAVLTLAAVLGLGEMSWRTRSPAERDRLWVRHILPRTPRERRIWVFVAAGAAIAEEIAYRGAFIAFATAATGSLGVAVIASAAAFAAVHAPQGLVGIAYVFVIALLHQALVIYTGTLALAMLVHFAYDVIAGLWLAKRHGLT